MKAPRRVLITGATSGLGREMARQLAVRGWRVAVTGRRAKLIAETAALVEQAGGEALPLVGSVSDAAAVREHVRMISDRWGGLDWAILNAGVGESEPPKQLSAELYRRTFETNVFGACHWIEAILPGMLAARSGVVAGISSPAGWRGLPGLGAYSSSKAALSTLLESLRIDLRGTGVKVVIVCPGYVKSEMTAGNDPGNMPLLLETDEGARRILRGIERGQRVVHFPWLLTWPLRHVVSRLPGVIYDPLVRRFIGRDGD